MAEFVFVTGMVLEVSPVNDYDRRLVILTKERGKISAFCRGARRVNNKLMAATNQFAFGTFKLFEGKSSYNIADAEISYYFEELRTDMVGAFYGMYFLEIASYYTRENNDETMMLKLLFQTIRAVVKGTIDNRLIRAVYEIKAIVINGDFPGVLEDGRMSETCRYTINYIVGSSIEKLYTFTLKEVVLNELIKYAEQYIAKCTDRKFKSLEMLEVLN